MGLAERNCELALRAKHGDKTALEELWRINQGLTYTIIRRYPTTKSVDIDDLWQSAWFVLLEAVRNFEPGRGEFATVFGWSIQKSCLIALGRLQKHVDEAVSLDTPLTDNEDATTLGEMIEDDTLRSASESLEESELRRTVAEAVNRLSDDKRDVIRALYFDRLTMRHASDRLRVPLSTIHSRRDQALNVLRRDKELNRWR